MDPNEEDIDIEDYLRYRELMDYEMQQQEEIKTKIEAAEMENDSQ